MDSAVPLKGSYLPRTTQQRLVRRSIVPEALVAHPKGPFETGMGSGGGCGPVVLDLAGIDWIVTTAVKAVTFHRDANGSERSPFARCEIRGRRHRAYGCVVPC
jgi:hypothetical protein